MLSLKQREIKTIQDGVRMQQQRAYRRHLLHPELSSASPFCEVASHCVAAFRAGFPGSVEQESAEPQTQQPWQADEDIDQRKPEKVEWIKNPSGSVAAQMADNYKHGGPNDHQAGNEIAKPEAETIAWHKDQCKDQGSDESSITMIEWFAPQSSGKTCCPFPMSRVGNSCCSV